jgi:mercuric reductase
VIIKTAGEILTDSCQRTANPRIWAAGDVTCGSQFVYAAAHRAGLTAPQEESGRS